MSERSFLGSVGLFVLRVGLGCMMLFGHGLDKLMHFGEKAAAFPDPLGLGSKVSLTLAIFAEVFCAALLILGVGTRLVVIPLIITMCVAALIVHADDPWQTKEKAFLFLTGFVTLFVAGGGGASLGSVVWNRLRRRPPTQSR